MCSDMSMSSHFTGSCVVIRRVSLLSLCCVMCSDTPNVNVMSLYCVMCGDMESVFIIILPCHV